MPSGYMAIKIVNSVEGASPPQVFNGDAGASMNKGVNTGYGKEIPILANRVTAKATHNFFESENMNATKEKVSWLFCQSPCVIPNRIYEILY